MNFNFDDFDDTNPTHQSIKQSLTYCFAPFNQCKNDGRQFHMTQLVQNGDPDKAGGGYLSWPYDSTRQNAYKLDGEPWNIEQFHLTLEVTGDLRDQVAVSVGVYRNSKLVELAAVKKPLDFGSAHSLLLQGDLPRPLIIQRQGKSGSVFTFRYGNPTLDGHRVFAFSSEDEGIGAWAQKKGERYSRARYCLEEDMTSIGKKKKVIGRRLKCSFPAW
ncbi:hypothetical protein AC579_6695 [Pseudocercospora musae]|uniref:Uncharacterized protein n=1 Tax=Pseudocercospora musae TaxID=113226 RepID=A0A139I011_9PEZI|nr:hypothetical protein AC579_6695 [Pseudocercospora musae]